MSSLAPRAPEAAPGRRAGRRRGHELRQALRFGGSSRFDDRRGLGRYGMGLPNSSFSQARRLEVLTWRSTRAGLRCALDIDEIASGVVQEVPTPLRATLRDEDLEPLTPSGTRVLWRRCDRLDPKRASTIAKHLKAELGRTISLWRTGMTSRELRSAGGGSSRERACPSSARGGRSIEAGYSSVASGGRPATTGGAARLVRASKPARLLRWARAMPG